MAAALDGIKVLDLSRILAGPWCTMTLADLGAEVWKIENPDGGDDTRTWMPPSVEGISTYYLSVNRSKKSVAIDLKTASGRAILTELASKADVFIENFRPASLKALGLSYESLSERNPRLIHCAISGYGRSTAFADRAGYDFVMQAETGFMSITGETDGNPMRLGVAFVDLATGANAIQSILAALFARERTGRGQSIDIALFDSGLHFLANIASGYLNTGSNPTRFGNAHPSIVPYQLFDTADGAIALAVGNDQQYRRLCRDVLAREELCTDERFRTNAGRTRQPRCAGAGAGGRDLALRHQDADREAACQRHSGRRVAHRGRGVRLGGSEGARRHHGGARPAPWRGAHGALAATDVGLADHDASCAAHARAAHARGAGFGAGLFG